MTGYLIPPHFFFFFCAAGLFLLLLCVMLLECFVGCSLPCWCRKQVGCFTSFWLVPHKIWCTWFFWGLPWKFCSFMLQKLFALVDGTAAPDNADALQHQEVLLPGHLLTIVVKVLLLLCLLISIGMDSISRMQNGLHLLCVLNPILISWTNSPSSPICKL